MLVTPPSVSVRTVMPATTTVNHMNVGKYENAGWSKIIAFHQTNHNDVGGAFRFVSLLSKFSGGMIVFAIGRSLRFSDTSKFARWFFLFSSHTFAQLYERQISVRHRKLGTLKLIKIGLFQIRSGYWALKVA